MKGSDIFFETLGIISRVFAAESDISASQGHKTISKKEILFV